MSDSDDRYTLPELAGGPSPVSEPSASLLPAVGAGLVAAIVGGVVWGLIAKFSDYEVGIVAWGIGFVAGTAVVAATRGGKGPDMQAIAVVSALLGVLLGKYLNFGFAAQRAGLNFGLFSGDMLRLFRENISDIFGLFDLLWIGLAVVTAWRVPQVVAAEPAAAPTE